MAVVSIMAPVDWDTVMRAKTSDLSDDDSDNLFALLSEVKHFACSYLR